MMFRSIHGPNTRRFFIHKLEYSYHLEDDTHMTDHQYDQGLAVYYATYIARFVLTPLEFVYLSRDTVH